MAGWRDHRGGKGGRERIEGAETGMKEEECREARTGRANQEWKGGGAEQEERRGREREREREGEGEGEGGRGGGLHN